MYVVAKYTVRKIGKLYSNKLGVSKTSKQLSAAIAMDTAERFFNSLKESEEKPLTSRQTSDEWVQAEDIQARMESKRQKKAGKRAADNKIQATPPKGTISQLKSSNCFALLSSSPPEDD